MSSFNMPALGGQDQNMKKVYSYIQMLNEQLQDLLPFFGFRTVYT